MGTRKRLTAVRAAEGGRDWRRLVTYVYAYSKPRDTDNNVVKVGEQGLLDGEEGKMGDICNSVNNYKEMVIIMYLFYPLEKSFQNSSENMTYPGKLLQIQDHNPILRNFHAVHLK